MAQPTKRTSKEDALREGVGDAFDFWLSQHPVSTPEIIMEGVEKAFFNWMDKHNDELIGLIASKMLSKMAVNSAKN